MVLCKNCSRELTGNEVGLYRKIIHREATAFLCLPCLAEHLKVPEQDLREMIDRFRQSGCTLFDPIN